MLTHINSERKLKLEFAKKLVKQGRRLRLIHPLSGGKCACNSRACDREREHLVRRAGPITTVAQIDQCASQFPTLDFALELSETILVIRCESDDIKFDAEILLGSLPEALFSDSGQEYRFFPWGPIFTLPTHQRVGGSLHIYTTDLLPLHQLLSVEAQRLTHMLSSVQLELDYLDVNWRAQILDVAMVSAIDQLTYPILQIDLSMDWDPE